MSQAPSPPNPPPSSPPPPPSPGSGSSRLFVWLLAVGVAAVATLAGVLVLVMVGENGGSATTGTVAPTTSTTTGASTTSTTLAVETTTTTVPPVGEWTWSLVSADGSTLGEGLGMRVVLALAAGGPGLVAVGVENPGGDTDAAVWTSTDGLTWSRVAHDEAVFGGELEQAMHAVVAGGPGLVAVGYDESGGAADWDAAVWTSADGLTWTRVPHDEAVFGGPDRQAMLSVTAGGAGLVAVGLDAPGGDWNVAVWTSVDGITWSRVPHDDASLGGPDGQTVSAVSAWAGGLVAVGEDSVGGEYDAAVWTSPDGVAWNRVPHDETVFGGEGTQLMEAVVAAGPGLVAVGLDGVPPDFDAAVWTSADGIAWSRVPHDEAVFGGEMVQVMSDVVATPGGLVAVGRDDSPAGVHLLVWTSPDGLTWSRVPYDEAVFGQSVELLTVSVSDGGPGLVVMDGGGAVWVAAPPG